MALAAALASSTLSGSQSRNTRSLKLHQDRTMTQPVVLITGALNRIGRATPLPSRKNTHSSQSPARRDVQGQSLAAERRKLGADAESDHIDRAAAAEGRCSIQGSSIRIKSLPNGDRTSPRQESD
jgi:hypothetical protein